MRAEFEPEGYAKNWRLQLGAIIPAAVGVDIGCGMIAVRTPFTKDDLDGRDLAALREQIERAIPLSAGRYNNKVVATAAPRIA
ncbi:hypothetical protein CTI14_51310, partial [Methylobacterium radiotolerans]